MSCAICEIRKEKRFCPAVHGRICPQCCGEQREVTLDCPSDCTYLVQAREHEKPRSPDQIDPAGLFLQVEISDQFMYEKEHLLMGLTYALAKAAHADRGLHDQDLIAALAVLTKRYERIVNSGLHYEQPLTSDSQRRAAAEVENMIKEYREAEQKHTGYSRCAEDASLSAASGSREDLGASKISRLCGISVCPVSGKRICGGRIAGSWEPDHLAVKTSATDFHGCTRI